MACCGDVVIGGGDDSFMDAEWRKIQPAQLVVAEVAAQFPAAEGEAWVLETSLPGRRVEVGRGFVARRRFLVGSSEKGFVDAAAAFGAGKEAVAVEYERREPNQTKVNIIHDGHNAAGHGLCTLQD